MENLIVYAKIAAFAGSAFAIALGTFGPALAQGMIGSKACENFVKCPESQVGSFRALVMLSLVIVETSSIYALLISGGLLALGYML
jgi:F0F1-type ATP synthase membrane subunit c/vacuolar-type H+-ATPase subunit K